MKKYALPHIRNRNYGHDQKGTQHKPFTPSFDDVSLRVADISPVAKGIVLSPIELKIREILSCQMCRRHYSLDFWSDLG